MKTFRFIGFAIFAILMCLSACSGGGDEPIEPTPKPEVIKSEITIDSSIISNGLSFTNEKGEQSISFSTNENWTLNVASTTSGATWCTASVTSGSKGAATVKFDVVENTTYDNRSVSVTIKSGTATKTFTISQKGVDALLVTTDKYEVSQEGGTIEIEVKANINYKMEISENAKDWIKESSSRALTAYKHKLDIAANEEVEKREGEITFKSGDKVETVKIYQAGGTILLLSQNEYNVSDKGDTISVDIKSNIDFGVQMPNVDWIIDEASTRGLSSHTLKYIISANNEYDNRSANIIFYDKNSDLKDTLKVVQAQKSSLFIKNWKEDNPSIYASGGETSLSISSISTWNAIIENEEAKDWLILDVINNDKAEGTLHIKTLANDTNLDRTANIFIRNEKDIQLIKIVQLQNITKRTPFNERLIKNYVTMEYDKKNFEKIVVILPVPQSNLYQDITNWKSDEGIILKARNNDNKYIKRIILPEQIPASGENILNETFNIINYNIYINFDAITTQVPINEESDVYSKYTNRNNNYIVPNHSIIENIADNLWEESSNNTLSYARKCYEYVAANMKYLNPNTGMHALEKILSDGGGDCGNQVSVYVSLLRNKKIPARHVVMFRTDGTYHVRAEFYLAGYGWIPVDVNAKNMNPNGDYFGKIESNEIIASFDINNEIEYNEGGL